MTRFSMKSKQCFKTLFKVLNKYFGGFVRHSLSLGENKICNIKYFPSKVLVVCLFVFFCFLSSLFLSLSHLEIKTGLCSLLCYLKKSLLGSSGRGTTL